MGPTGGLGVPASGEPVQIVTAQWQVAAETSDGQASGVNASTSPHSARLLDADLTLQTSMPVPHDGQTLISRLVPDEGRGVQYFMQLIALGFNVYDRFAATPLRYGGFFAGFAGFGGAEHGIIELQNDKPVHGVLDTGIGLSSSVASYARWFADLVSFSPTGHAAALKTLGAAAAEVNLYLIMAKLTYDYVQWLLTDPMGDSPIVKEAQTHWRNGEYLYTPPGFGIGHRF
jgi:hypothetical protein